MGILVCKYNIRVHWAATLMRCCSAGLFCLLFLSSCADNNEDFSDTSATGKELQLRACWEMEPEMVSSRGTTENVWRGNEEITVTAGQNSKPYLVSADGSLTPGSDGALFWTATNQMLVSAYYSPIEPISTHFHIEEDQTQTVNSATALTNFDRSDALYAPPISVNYGETAELAFRHLAAYVVVHVTADSDEGIDDMSPATILFNNQHIESGELSTDGTVAQRTTAGTKTIIPVELESTTEFKEAKALLVPQRSVGFTFITVSFNNGSTTYSYTPYSSKPISLEAGKKYTFNLLLTKANLVLKDEEVVDWDVTSETIKSEADDSEGDDSEVDDTETDLSL